MKSLLLPFVCALPLATSATLVGFNFTSINGGGGQNGANGTFDDLSGFGTAGVGPYAQANWNHFEGDWGGELENDTTHANLVDSTGAAVTHLAPHFGADRVKYDAATAYTSGIGNGSSNDTLMDGYLDDGGDNQPYTEFDLKYNGEAGAAGIASYTVVLYLHGDGPDSAIGRYWLEDFGGSVLTDQVGINSNDYTGSFLQAGGANFSQTLTPGNVDVANGNYLVFDNITADTIRVRSAGNGDPEDFGRGPLNAVQLLAVVVPEPASGLLLFGGAALLGLMRKMRRRG